MITLTSWQPHAHCRWCERNGGWPVADFGQGFLRDVPLCFGCLTHAVRIRVRETNGVDATDIVLHLPADIAHAAIQRCGSPSLPAWLRLKPEQPLSGRRVSRCFFRLSAETQFTATAAAISLYGTGVILSCLRHLQQEAAERGGLAAVQVFEDEAKPEPLWIIEDAGDSVVALLPSNY